MRKHLTAKRTMAAGLAGTGAVVAAMAVARRSGLTRIAFPRILATLVTEVSPASVGAAGVFFVANGVLLALAYRTVLREFGGTASVSRGATLGFAHGLVAAGSAGVLSPMHPRPHAARLASSGTLRPDPKTLGVIVAVHVLYGAVLGAVARGRMAASFTS